MIGDRIIQKQRRVRAEELLQEGLSTRQIADRTGMTQRSVLRLKKKLEEQGVQAQSQA